MHFKFNILLLGLGKMALATVTLGTLYLYGEALNDKLSKYILYFCSAID